MLLPLMLASSLSLAADPANIRVDWLPAEPWSPGQRLYVAGHEVNLRAAATTDAPVVRELALGTPVTVQALLADGVEVGGRPGRWYAVAVEGAEGTQGALFGGVLSPARLDADPDQDGELEIVVFTWGWEHHKVVRVREPALEGADAVTQLDLGPTHDIEGPQVELWAALSGAEATGIPLLTLHTPGREMCGSGSATHYISYRSPARGELGVLREAVREHRWADAPVYDAVELQWDPAALAVTAKHTTYDGDLEDGGSGREQITVTRRVLREGVFVAEGSAAPSPR
jgi:hypothetical protein